MAGGCFWGLERAMQNVDGVLDTTVGYAQSTTPDPTYRMVCSGTTHAVETVRIDYDPMRVSLRTLTLLFLSIIDPFSVDRQGNDVGSQYRSGLYPAGAHAAEQRAVYEQALDELTQRPDRLRPLRSRICAISRLRSPNIRITCSPIQQATVIFH